MVQTQKHFRFMNMEQAQTLQQPRSDEPRLENVRSSVEVRVHGKACSPTLVYLPGIHGDWTLVGGFRRALGEKLRFIEISYPLGTHWTEGTYAAAIVQALAEREISSGWLLGESFGSQVAWEICRSTAFSAEGLILAGGFVRHPLPFLAKWLYARSGERTFRVMRAALGGYAQVARLRFGRSPETLAEIREFVARRTRADFESGRHRLQLVARHDPRCVARSLYIPVYAVCGCLDPVVPWFPVQRWLKRNCPGFQEAEVIWPADHNVLGTAPKRSAEKVLAWMFRQPATGHW
jgi:pimeloyl-ACP methyl ester carboxylesterase